MTERQKAVIHGGAPDTALREIRFTRGIHPKAKVEDDIKADRVKSGNPLIAMNYWR